METDRSIAFLVLVLVVALGAYIFLYAGQQAGEVTQVQAENFTLQDAHGAYGNSAEYEVLSSSRQGTQWEVTVKIVTDARTRCPKIYKRYYSLLPIRFREEAVNDKCVAGAPLLYKEEAIIASSALLEVRALPLDATATAREFSRGEASKLRDASRGICSSYPAPENGCSPSMVKLIEIFTSSNPSGKAWIVDWEYPANLLQVIVDESGTAYLIK